ncbi:unnamed protein product [Ilex paraguariensis]|uniref:BZIP domain-containing protein n=1 Tax=Ilex paraguariensis TaxID=185542 RepID=A0ABC8RZN1_9AQUA
MAQLPPKVPNNMTPNWQVSHQRLPSMECLATNTNNLNSSWVDEFLDFSSGKRGSHRRSVSDSIAFLEAPMVEECRRPSEQGSEATNEFDRFDDEQFMSMFTDDIAMSVGPTLSCSNPSSPSDHNSINDDKQTPSEQLMQQMKIESDEVQSSCKSDGQVTPQSVTDNSGDRVIDPKRIRRILANRQSAQRSRVKKLQYISELERSVTSLQAEVAVLSPRVAFLDHQRLVLNVDNSVLKQRIAALAQDKIFKDAHQEALKKEIERLRQVYYQQNLNKMDNATPPQSQPQSSVSDVKGPMEKEQLVN